MEGRRFKTFAILQKYNKSSYCENILAKYNLMWEFILENLKYIFEFHENYISLHVVKHVYLTHPGLWLSNAG